jgi:hypothetical protein
MPAPEIQDERRDVRLINGLFWGGVGVAPLAALLLLLGQAGALRIAAVLAILAVVMIGLSITLRGNSDAVRVEIEEALYEEIDTLRKDVREDIGTAARATHKAFGEKLQLLYEQLNAVRAQLDALRAEAGRTGYDRPAPGPPVGAAGIGQTMAGQTMGGQGAGPIAPASPPGGMVRHTETVQVTTRQTIVDPRRDDPSGGTYGRRGEPDEAGWSGQRSRAEGRRARSYDRDEEPRYEAPRYPEPRYEEPRHPEQRYDDRWSGARAGDRWGTVRDDDRGRELRMGERRAAVHADDSGTELRYEDRWAAVREEPRRDGRRDERGGWRGERSDREGWQPQTGQRGQQAWDDGRREREEPRPPEPGRRPLALPAGGQSPQLWDSEEPDRLPAGRRRRDEDQGYRYGQEPDDRWRR